MLTPTLLSDEFERYKSRSFVFVSPGGNWGDGLIWWGAQRLAEEHGLRHVAADFTTFLAQDISTESVIYLHGSGGFNRWSSGRARKVFEKAVSTHRGVTIQGPQTCENSKDYAGSLFQSLNGRVVAERVVLFARERMSYDLLRESAPSWVEVGLDVDTALHLTRDDFVTRAGMSRQSYNLLAVREDNEATAAECNGHLDAVRIDPARYAHSFKHWLRLHAAAKQIVTNRTHSAIAGSVLGTPTTLMPGSYHKNRSIWEFALRERGVQWADTYDQVPLGRRQRRNIIDVALSAGAKSWKVKRVLLRLKGVPVR